MKPSDRARLAWQAVVSTGWFCLLAFMGARLLEIPYLTMLLAVLGMVGCSSVLGLYWIYQWAVKSDSKLGQFHIGSLLFASIFVAFGGVIINLFLPAVRRFDQSGPEALLMMIPVGLALLVVTFLCAVRMTESIMWLSVWIVGRSGTKAVVRGLRKKLGSKKPDEADEKAAIGEDPWAQKNPDG